MLKNVSGYLLLLLLCGCAEAGLSSSNARVDAHANPQQEDVPNILIVLADDLGTESLSLYGRNHRNAETPNLNQLAAKGTRFERFWAQPTCSTSRASALTGRYAFRHGVQGPLWNYAHRLGVDIPSPPRGAPKELNYTPLGVVKPGVKQILPQNMKPPVGLSSDEVLLPAILKESAGYATAAFGKWHLAADSNGWFDHPNLAGFDHFSGPIEGTIPSHFAWPHVENGNPRVQTGYIDQYSVNEARRWIQSVPDEQPWFVWFSFINPHYPFHKPPSELIHSDSLKNLDPEGVSDENTSLYFRAQVEAMDSLFGQLLAAIPDEQRNNTVVIWLGDNGDDVWARPREERGSRRFKMTGFEGGVNVPVIVKGPNVSRGAINNSLVHIVDLFNTVLDFAAIDASERTDGKVLDSLSLKPLLTGEKTTSARKWMLSEVAMREVGVAIKTVRNQDYKLIRSKHGEQLFNLTSDPDESTDLLDDMSPEDQRNYRELRAKLEP